MPDTTDVFDIIRTTRAMRRLKPDPVPDGLIRKIIEAGVCAPNGGNTQRWRFLVVKDQAIKKKVQAWYKRAFDEVVGPRYLKSSPPPGVTKEAYVRQHAAVEYLTDHFHEAPVWIVACIEEAGAPTRWSGASIYPAVQNMLLAARALGLGRSRRHADHASPPLREGDRGRAGTAARRALVRHRADRLSAGEVRPRRPWPAQGICLRGSVGPAVPRRGWLVMNAG
jgi:nitroreductase